MSYSVTVKNDAQFCNGHGIVHTWLVLKAPGEKEIHFGFSPKNGMEYYNVEGVIDKEDYLKTRNHSESITFDIDQKQYQAMTSAINDFTTTVPTYDLLPDTDSNDDYNCTKAADAILQSGGINFLDGVQSPFGVAGRINGFASGICPIDLSTGTAVSDIISSKIAKYSVPVTADLSFNYDGKIYDFGLAETSLDLIDFLNRTTSGAWDAISGWFDSGENNTTFLGDFLGAILNGLVAGNVAANAFSELFNYFGENTSLPAWMQEFQSYYLQNLLATSDMMKHFSEGESIPIDALKSLNLPLDALIDDMLASGFWDNYTYPSLIDAENTAGDPIIIDLDGDGIETLSLEKNVFFDHDDNQFAENTGWISADDGLLVLDRNHDGKIDTGKELFGNNTILSDGTNASNGYVALRELDTNNDNLINNKDIIWDNLQIWQDKNSNAKVDEGELFSLNELGLVSISTDYIDRQSIDQQGNTHSQQSTVTWDNGITTSSSDVWFQLDKNRSQYIGNNIIDNNVRDLPFIRGTGNMTNLHIAM